MNALPHYQKMAAGLVRRLNMQARVRGSQWSLGYRMMLRRFDDGVVPREVPRKQVNRLLTGKTSMRLEIFLELADDIFGEGTAERICEAVSGRRGESHAD